MKALFFLVPLVFSTGIHAAIQEGTAFKGDFLSNGSMSEVTSCSARAYETSELCCYVTCASPEVATCYEPSSTNSCAGARCYCSF